MRTASLFTILALTLAAASSRAAPAARPGSFQVSPVRVELSSSVRTGLVALRNDEAEAARFQVTAWAWSQSTDGKVELEPTRDVSFFPSLFELAPGQTRQVRIGVSLPPSTTERTYRIIIEQLPSLAGGEAGTVRVLTRLSIPVFQAPSSGAAQVKLDAPAVRAGHVHVAVRNTGALHEMLKPVTLVARDAEGNVLVKRSEPGWYLLAGGERLYDFELPAELCPRLRSLSVETATASHPFATSTAFSVSSCGR